jgi:CDGSH iron-sulfur domain-containing protein 3
MRNPVSQATDTPDTSDVRIEFITDGPVRITGGVTLVKEDGTAERQERVFLCRCGGSARKPFCDSTHKRNGFRSGT